jgi:hypothetical protein
VTVFTVRTAADHKDGIRSRTAVVHDFDLEYIQSMSGETLATSDCSRACIFFGKEAEFKRSKLVNIRLVSFLNRMVTSLVAYGLSRSHDHILGSVRETSHV